MVFFYEKFQYIFKKFQLFFLFLYYKIKFVFAFNLNFNKFKIQYLLINQYINMFYKQFYYICIVKKTRSNFFITITNRMGEVLISYSIGKVKELRKRKKRKSIRSISLIISRIGVILKKKKLLSCISFS